MSESHANDSGVSFHDTDPAQYIPPPIDQKLRLLRELVCGCVEQACPRRVVVDELSTLIEELVQESQKGVDLVRQEVRALDLDTVGTLASFVYIETGSTMWRDWTRQLQQNLERIAQR